MQQIKYAATAWNDIKHSPGWFGKLALLALLGFIPVFGQIVTYGYVYGWARDIAWGVHAPMPARLFGNEDGKLYSRGFFVLVVTVVFLFVPAFVGSIAMTMVGAGAAYDAHSGSVALTPALGIFGFLLALVATVGALAASMFVFIASMRTSIYDRISAGFQLKKLWAMFRYDANGALRIFGMSILLGVIGSFALSIIAGILSTIAFGTSAPAMMGLMSQGNPSSYDVMRVLAPSFFVFSLLMFVLAFFATMYSVFVFTMVARAAGYWTQQFNVAQWRGQDDPMPFEADQMYRQAQQAQYAAQVQYAQAQADYAQAQGQQVNYQHQQAQRAYAQAEAAQQAQVQAQAAQQAQAQAQAAQQAQAAVPTAFAAESLVPGAEEPTTPEAPVSGDAPYPAVGDAPQPASGDVAPEPAVFEPLAPTASPDAYGSEADSGISTSSSIDAAPSASDAAFDFADGRGAEGATNADSANLPR